MIYNIDFDKLAGRLLPSFLKKPMLIAWVRLLVSPLRYVNDELVSFVADKRIAATYTGQVMILQRALNREFAMGSGGNITITDTGVLYPRYYTYYKREGAGYLGNYYHKYETVGALGNVWFRGEYANQIHFTVRVPSATVASDESIRAFVNQYKVAGKRFQIIRF